MKYWVKMPPMLQWTLRKAWWQFPNANSEIFLTFDDGPHERITPFVLDALSAANARATFFLTGERAQAHPALVQEMLKRGHAIGSHSHSHPDGWKVKREIWLDDVHCGHEAVEQAAGRKLNLFRPPYGKMPRGASSVLPPHWQVVMWSVMPGDFDAGKAKEKVLSDALHLAKGGQIFVLHDNEKSEANLRYMLPPLLAALPAKGLKADALPLSAGE